MYRTHKSATCCYCGTKSVLTLSEGKRHELKCSNCGAPISKMKSLREDKVEDRYTFKNPARPLPAGKQRKKRKKSLAYRFFDLAEDFADELLDIFD